MGRLDSSTRGSGVAALALAVAAGLAACQPADRAAEEEAARAEDPARTLTAELDSMRTAFEEAVGSGDFEGQAAVYTGDAILAQPGVGIVQGRDSIRSVLRSTTPPGASLDIRPLELKRIGDDWLYEVGTSILTYTPEGADERQRMRANYIALLKRTPDGWRIHRESISPAGTPPGSGD